MYVCVCVHVYMVKGVVPGHCYYSVVGGVEAFSAVDECCTSAIAFNQHVPSRC